MGFFKELFKSKSDKIEITQTAMKRLKVMETQESVSDLFSSLSGVTDQDVLRILKNGPEPHVAIDMEKHLNDKKRRQYLLAHATIKK